jgi:hypothetical protein
MPRDTFLKLDDNKRKLFLHEAYKEFSINSYEGASITRLVKTLGIAKGSVYQYFNDKEDLYCYLVEDASSRLGNLLDKACPFKGEAFFEWYKKLLIVELKFYLSFPKYAKMFQQVDAGAKSIDRKLARHIKNANLTRIKFALPIRQHSNQVGLTTLSKSPLLLFSMLTENLDIEQIIITGDPIYIESAELLELSAKYVNQLDRGLIV